MAGELPLEFHPAALAELELAKAWYDAQRQGLGGRSSTKSLLPSPEYEKPRMPGRNISEEQSASLCIASRSRLSIANTPTVCSSSPSCI